MNFLHLPNERDETSTTLNQVGPRKAFARLAREGRIDRLETFSFLSQARTRGVERTKHDLLSFAEKFRPDIVFWQHVAGFPIDPAFVVEFKQRSGCRILTYHEGDPFDPWVKRIDTSTSALLSGADLVLGIGTGWLFDLFRRHSTAPMRHLPHCFDNVRFGTPWAPTLTRSARVSMIGNRGSRRRLPFLYVPGGRTRARLASRLSAIYGRDFALYGRGWGRLSASRGLLPFDQQESAIRDSWLSVNYDHFDDMPSYFSDRLPISLAAGVPHVTSYHEGYERLLGDCPGLYWGKTTDEIVERVDWLLSRPPGALVEEGLAAKTWVEANLEADIVFARAFDLCVETLEGRLER